MLVKPVAICPQLLLALLNYYYSNYCYNKYNLNWPAKVWDNQGAYFLETFDHQGITLPNAQTKLMSEKKVK